MRKSFKVAGHVFSFCLPEAHPLWKELKQYDPFALSSDEEGIFEIELADSLPESPRSKVYGGNEEPGEPAVFLYRGEGFWEMEMSVCKGRHVCGRLRTDEAFSKGSLLITEPREALFALNNAAMLLFAFRTAPLSTLEMHASVIVNSGKAFLWLARSGTGKSTHSKLWLRHVPGSSLLNDDNPVVRIIEDGSVVVYGSPWSGKTPCYKNERYPAGAFVEIKRSPANRIVQKNVFESYALLYSSSSGFKNDSSMAGELHSTFEKIATTIPCYTLECRPDAEAAAVCSAELLAL